MASIRIAGLVLMMFVTACALDDSEDPEWTEDDNVVTEQDQAGDQELDDLLQDGKADGALSYKAVAQLAKNAGVSCSGDRIAIATAVAKAESGFRATITNTAGNAHGIDRGLWQINSYWHPEVSAACALSASCNARAAARISSGGTRWSQWWTFKNGKHLPFMSQARAAKAAVCP
jgi:lysozyme-like protein